MEILLMWQSNLEKLIGDCKLKIENLSIFI
jgi:hypothetical protein